MSISSTVSRTNAVGSGSTNIYPYTFKIFQAIDLLVTILDLSNNQTTLALSTDYTVQGMGVTAGGNITLVNSGQAWLDGGGNLLTGYAITIRRVRDLVQPTSIRNQGEFYPDVHENTFDELCMSDQQQQDDINRSMKFPETDTIVANDLPVAAVRASKVLGFDPSGQPIAAAGVTGLPATTFGANLIAEPDAPSARNLLQIDGVSGVIHNGDLAPNSVTTPKIAAGAVTNPTMASVPGNTVKGNNTGGPLPPADLTVAQLVAMMSASLGIFIPVGATLMYGGAAAPTNFLLCDGSSLLRASYPALFAAIGTAFGSSDGTHFNLPDLRGRFVRGIDAGSGNDPDVAGRLAMNPGGNTGNNVGSIQADAFQGHRHDNNVPQGGAGGGSLCPVGFVGATGTHDWTGGDPVTDGTNGAPRTTSESRPKNAYMNFIIRYQ